MSETVDRANAAIRKSNLKRRVFKKVMRRASAQQVNITNSKRRLGKDFTPTAAFQT